MYAVLGEEAGRTVQHRLGAAGFDRADEPKDAVVGRVPDPRRALYVRFRDWRVRGLEIDNARTKAVLTELDNISA
jgi:hypothetical protein